MSERKSGHEQFRNLFKGKEQSGISLAVGTPKQNSGSRKRDSTKSNMKSQLSPSRGKHHGAHSKSGKSMKKTSGQRKLSSEKKGARKKTSRESQSPTSSSPHHRTGSRPRTPNTAKTPPTESRGRSNKKNSTGAPSPTSFAGKDIQEKTMVCNTVFENDDAVGLTTTGGGVTSEGGGGGHIKLAAAKIKERKLQWVKDPQHPENTAPPSEGGGSGHEDMKKDVKHEANNTIIERTVFDNDDNTPAVVKEEKPKLQWAPGVKPEPPVISEPRKKKTTETQVTSEPRKKRTSDAHTTPIKGSPVDFTPVTSSPVRRSTTGSTDHEAKEEAAEKMVSCYIAPTLQVGQYNSAEHINKDPCEAKKQ